MTPLHSRSCNIFVLIKCLFVGHAIQSKHIGNIETKQKKKPTMHGMDQFSSRFTIQNVVLYEPFVNRSLTGRYQVIISAVGIRYSCRCRCGKMAVVERD